MIKETVDAIENAEKKAEERIHIATNEALSRKERAQADANALRALKMHSVEEDMRVKRQKLEESCKKNMDEIRRRIDAEVSMIDHLSLKKMDETIETILEALIS